MITTAQVSIPNQDLSINAFLATPEGAGPFPAVIVIQEIFGVNFHIRDITQRLAKLGYVAIAPAIYQRLAPNFETGYTPEAVTIGREYKNQTRRSEILSDIQATINYLYTLPQVKKTGVGAIGFCFGGHVTYLTAILPDIKATASFYGAGIVNWCPGENQSTITYSKDIQNTIHLFFGQQDPSIPPEDIKAIENELKKYEKDYQIFLYPEAEHGFFCDQRASYHQTSALDAWEKVKQLFESKLT